LNTDVNVFQQIQALEPNAQLLLYQGYPGLFGDSYSNRWNEPNSGPGAPANPSSAGRLAYVSMLETELANQGVNIGVVRSGEVLMEIDVVARANQLGSIPNVEYFYEPISTQEPDGKHLTVEGDFIAYSTMYHTIYGVVPTTIPTEFTNDINWTLTSAQIAKINDVIAAINHNPGSIYHQCVPEPSAWMFGLVGLVIMGGMRWKRFLLTRKNAA
jgi:hypothetical protein